ncbi:MAG: right-handed parallel beta-helix repeat-containing protein [Phycisphaeraceae bacterium JB051]
MIKDAMAVLFIGCVLLNGPLQAGVTVNENVGSGLDYAQLLTQAKVVAAPVNQGGSGTYGNPMNSEKTLRQSFVVDSAFTLQTVYIRVEDTAANAVIAFDIRRVESTVGDTLVLGESLFHELPQYTIVNTTSSTDKVWKIDFTSEHQIHLPATTSGAGYVFEIKWISGSAQALDWVRTSGSNPVIDPLTNGRGYQNEVGMTDSRDFTLLMIGDSVDLSVGRVEIIQAGQANTVYSTINAAVDAAVPGDVIRLSQGTYHQTVIIDNKHASETTPYVLQAAAGHQVIITGAWADAQVQNSQVWSAYSGYPGSYVADVPGDSDRDAMVVRPDTGLRVNACRNMAEFQTLNDAQMPTRSYRDQVAGKQYIRLDAGATDPNTLALEVATDAHVLQIDDSSHWLIDGIEFRIGGDAVVKVGNDNVSYLTFSNIIVTEGHNGLVINSNSDPLLMPHHITITDSFFRLTNDPLWWRGDIYQNPYNSGANPMTGAALVVNGNDNLVTGCVMEGGFDILKFRGTNSTVAGNVIRNATDDAVEMETGSTTPAINLHFRDNLVYDCLVGLSVTCNPGPVYIYRNVILANKHHVRRSYSVQSYQNGLYGFKIAKATWEDLENVNIYHNSVYGYRWGIRDSPWKGEGPGIVDTRWYNNMVVTQVSHPVRRTGVEEDGVWYDGNLWYAAEYTEISQEWDGEGAVSTIPQIHAISNFEQSGVIADPLLTDWQYTTPGALFLLIPSANSPLIDAATALPTGWQDSVTVTDGLPNIGAHEQTQTASDHWQQMIELDAKWPRLSTGND